MHDFEIYAGDSRVVRITVRDSATGDVVDLTGATIAFAVARNFNESALFEKTTSDGIAINSPATAGIMEVTLDPEDTEELNGRYYFECEVIEQGGAIGTVISGEMLVKPVLITSTDSP